MVQLSRKDQAEVCGFRLPNGCGRANNFGCVNRHSSRIRLFVAGAVSVAVGITSSKYRLARDADLVVFVSLTCPGFMVCNETPFA